MRSTMFMLFALLLVGVNGRYLKHSDDMEMDIDMGRNCKSFGFTKCNACVDDDEYGYCDNSDAMCPDGSKFVCNGGNCPSGLDCKYVNDKCDKHCWGVTQCSGSSCPQDYKEGMFCKQDGSSKNFKVCDHKTVAPPKVDCEVSDWTVWSNCSSTGFRIRTRSVTKNCTHDGKECPLLKEVEHCPVDCVLSPWSGWTGCINNVQTRTRVVQISPLNGGMACPTPLQETQSCIGCGPIISEFECTLDLTSPTKTTTCTVPGGVLTVDIPNRRGMTKATVRVFSKAVGYMK